ncbi:MAG: hypothetical protein KGI50_03585 [Patescibacteria group bacterium]|nr:hypothetical protein [Patescibacteria group bacterium]MDE2438374.1 hypothetical protein [Patescibacteria group bacterium]
MPISTIRLRALPLDGYMHHEYTSSAKKGAFVAAGGILLTSLITLLLIAIHPINFDIMFCENSLRAYMMCGIYLGIPLSVLNGIPHDDNDATKIVRFLGNSKI